MRKVTVTVIVTLLSLSFILSPQKAFALNECVGGADAIGRCQEACGRADKQKCEDLKAAINGYKEACDKGDSEICVGLGLSYTYGLGVKADAARAAEIFEQGCKAGNAKGCFYLASTFVSNGVSKGKDPARAIALWQQGCDGGYIDSCSALASLYDQGIEMPRDIERALMLWRKACKGGDESSCRAVENLLGEAETKKRGIK